MGAERVLPAEGVIWARQLIGVTLILAGVVTAGLARFRWHRVDCALKAGQPIPRPLLGYAVGWPSPIGARSDELVRAAEGVPREALNIAAKAALHSAERKVSVPDVRSAARTWFQADKEAALRGREEAQRLLNWITDKVIKQKRARSFMVNQKAIGSPLLRALFDARVLHVVRRGYSAQDEPGERYDVYVIDYGAYVDLIHTKYAPLGLLPFTGDGGYTDVPPEDLRALRRAILDLQEFDASADGSTEVTATAATSGASQQHLDL